MRSDVSPALAIHHGRMSAQPPAPRPRTRDRVTVDLRGLRARLQSHAQANGQTIAVLVRSAIVAMLDDAGPIDPVNPRMAPPREQTLKVTLRLPVAHAVLLARRARAADQSQGRYLAALLDGYAPRPITPEGDRAVSALIGSTYRLATLSADINAHLRAWREGASGDFEQYRMDDEPIGVVLQEHLRLASQVVAELRPAQPWRGAVTAPGSVESRRQ